MSEVFNYSVGDTIFLELYVQSNTGEGKEGLYPTVSIRNLETEYYLDFNINVFSLGSGSNGDSKKPYLTDLGGGLYRKVWDSSAAVTTSMKLVAEYEISSGSFKGKDFDYLFFSSFENDISIIKQIESGRWKIIDNQMIFYEENGTTPLLVFDLKDNSGVPNSVNVFERIPSGSI
jgi:hypothetical protein